MLDALQSLGCSRYHWESDGSALIVHGGAGKITCPSSPIWLGNAGTAARFLTAVATLAAPTAERTATQLVGNARMHERPIRDLVAALKANGSYLF